MWYFRPLDWLNFFLADVRGGLGPYVGVFLLTQADWNQATIGAVLTVSGLIGITLHTPIGALIDATHFKRGLIIGGTCALAISAVAIAWAPTLPIVLTADILMAVAGAIFAPTVAAITLGITNRQALPARLGRNAAFDRAGNIFIAVLAGVVGWGFSQRAVFYLVPLFALLTSLAVLSIPAHSIDHDRARGLDENGGRADHQKPAGWQVLVRKSATAGARCGECNVPLRQCSHAAAARTETSAFSSRPRDCIGFSEHHHGAARYDSHCVAGWMEGQYLGTQVPFAGRVCGAANPRFVVYNFR